VHPTAFFIYLGFNKDFPVKYSLQSRDFCNLWLNRKTYHMVGLRLYKKIMNVDFHCDERFPEGNALAASFAMLSPGSKARANLLGVVASISIN